ncbi:hypothetical protein EMCRGX_G005409 [Ephydatia muelleri]
MAKSYQARRPHPRDPRCLVKPWPKRRPQPLDPGEALPDQLTEAAAPPARTTRSQTLDLPVIHTSQTRFNCPASRLQLPALLHSEPCQQHSRPLSSKQHRPVASNKSKTGQSKGHHGENTAGNLHQR